MRNKLIFIISLLAWGVVPGIAAASPVLTEGGAAVGVGNGITGTEDGNVQFTTADGNISCDDSHLEAEVNSNTGNHIAMTVKSATFTSGNGNGCPGAIPPAIQWVVKATTPWCLTSSTAGSANLRNGSCGTTGGKIKFLFVSGKAECEYQTKAEVINATYVSNVEPLTIAFEEKAPAERIRMANFMCPAEAFFDAKYTLETPNGAKLKIS